MGMVERVIVIGLDGLEPSIAEAMSAAGRLPNLDRLRRGGGYARLRTTLPAQTPVAWSSFAVGANPGVHGIFDFLHRDPATYRPAVSLFRYEQANRFLPPRAVNQRQGRTVWSLLSDAGIPSTILRHPATYPPDRFDGRLLAGVGVPDIRGGFGTCSYFSSDDPGRAPDAEHTVRVTPDAGGGVHLPLRGPRMPKGGDALVELALNLDVPGGRATIEAPGGVRVETALGGWSAWLPVRFRMGALQTARGMVRFHLAGVSPLRLHASPVHFDPEVPPFAISHPWDYAAELKEELGPYHTLGMAEEHGALNNGRISEEAYLAQCMDVFEERRAMMHYELSRFERGLFYCLFDSPDRIQHMFWRFRDAAHPAHGGAPVPPAMAAVIEDHYAACDGVVGEALSYADDRTLVAVLSDHGFTDYRRSFHLNAWLHRRGYLALRPGIEAGAGAGDLLEHVDWARTRAYALGMSGLFFNLRGREAEGTVDPADAPALAQELAAGLTGLHDPDGGAVAVRRALPRDLAYRGDQVHVAPDVLLCCAPGYRISSASAMGGVPDRVMEDNTHRWSGDHVVDPDAVPGVLFMNQAFDDAAPAITDLAPTILSALGAPRGPEMEGRSLVS